MEKIVNKVNGPPSGFKFIIFIDDLNMPQPEQWGAQPPIELVRQFIDHGGWYIKKDAKKIPFHKIIYTQVAAAMGPPGGGRHVVTNRLLRHFNHLAFTEMEDDSYRRIFSTILGAFFTNNDFPEPLRTHVNDIVDATIDVFSAVCRELLPTPKKSHYTFNMRDMAKVFQGLLSAHKPAMEQLPDLVRLWIHETSRVFRDRLTDTPDREWFDKVIRKQLRQHFGMTMEDAGWSDDVLYGNLNSPAQSETKPYVQLTDAEKLQHNLDEALDELRENQSGPRMDLVMFRMAIRHLARISRIIRQPYGNALLLGVGGSGRQSLSRLAAHMADFDLLTVEIKKGFGQRDWHARLKEILRVCGGIGNGGNPPKPQVFLFTDTQILMESFLEDINSILNSGEVPNIFDPEKACHAFRPPPPPCALVLRGV